jgi:3-oxoacyl-[acyl-carrier-protein] synthase III
LLPVSILGTSREAPGPAVPTADVTAVAFPGRDPADLIARSGISSRHWAPPGTLHAAVGERVLRAALQDAGLLPADLRRVIFVNSSGNDVKIPATVNHLLHRLEMAGTADGFDLNNACMGYLSAMDIAARSVATGLGPVAVVVVELLSRHIGPENPRSYAVLADAAAAVIFGASRGGAGVLGGVLGNDGSFQGSVTLAHGYVTGQRETIQFGASNKQITTEAVDAVERSALQALDAAGLRIDQLDWVLAHQPNGVMLGRIAERLGIELEKTVPVVDQIGSTGACAIPFSLDVLRRRGDLLPGQHVLMVGVGSGMSFGATVYREAVS